MEPIPDAVAFLTGFEEREVPKGYLLSTPASLRDQVFLVRSGRLRVYLAGENRELSLAYLEPGDIFSTHTPTYVEAVTPAVLGVMDTAAFARQLAVSPGATPVLMRVLGRLLENAVTLVEDLAFREVPDRLGRFLLGQAESRGKPVAEGLLIPLDLGVEDIASLLGTTRQTVSALINQWERDGILRRQGRKSLLIFSLAGLMSASRRTGGGNGP